MLNSLISNGFQLKVRCTSVEINVKIDQQQAKTRFEAAEAKKKKLQQSIYE